MIRKVLMKIKNALSEQEQLKSSANASGSNKLTASNIEEFIAEIDTCIKKCEVQEKDLNSIESGINARRE